MRTYARSIAVAFAIGAVLALAPFVHAQAPAAACDKNAKKLNMKLTMKDVHGKPVSLSSYAGKVLLVDFWATWCGPCKVEIPGFVKLYDRYRAQGFEIVGLITEDPISNVPAFAKEYGMNYTVLDANNRDDVEAAFGSISGLPTSFLISRDGRICKTHLGYTPNDEFEREITALLGVPAAPRTTPAAAADRKPH